MASERAYAASLRAEADDLAAITGETGAGDDWAARATEYAGLQARILRDMHAREASAAEEYAADDPELAKLLGLGLGLGDDDGMGPDLSFAAETAAPPPPAGGLSTAHQPAPQTMAAAAVTRNTVLSAAELEAQLLGMDAPVPSAGAGVSSSSRGGLPAPPPPSSSAAVASPRGVPTLLSVEDMSRVPLPIGWRVGMPLPANTFLVFDEEEEGAEAEAQRSAPAVDPQHASSGGGGGGGVAGGGPPTLTSHPAALLLPPVAQAQAPIPPAGYVQQPSPYPPPAGGYGGPGLVSPPPPGYPSGGVQQGYPSQGGPPPLAMPGVPQGMPPGLLAPQALQMMQVQYSQLVQAIQSRPGGAAAPVPPQVEQQLGWLQVMLQRHFAALQYLQRAQQGVQPPLPRTGPPPTPAGGQQGERGPTGTGTGPASFAQAVGGGGAGPAHSAAPASDGKQAGVTIVQRPQAAGGRVVQGPPPLPSGPAPPLPSGAPPARGDTRRPAPPLPEPAQPVTMATVLTAKVPPPRALQDKSRMSMGDILSVCRAMFNQLSALDPFTECYYALVLQTKKAAQAAATAEAARRVALGQAPAPPSASGLASRGNILDVAATLTEMGDRAIAAGRGGKGEAGQGGDSAGHPGGRGGAGGEAEPLSAAAALIAALPVSSLSMTNVRANQADLKKLHAVKRRLWEQHNSVLGRQESANVRAPKRMLNLSKTGTTTADDLRDGTESNTDGTPTTPAKERGGVGSPVNATPAASLWAVRARIDAAHEGILALQEAARKQQSALRARPPPSGPALEQGRAEVAFRRSNLAEIVGVVLGEGDTPAYAVDDGALLALLTLPKGKRVVRRLVPMLEPPARVAAITACMRTLPYCVASATPGKDYEEADAALASALSSWMSSTAPTPRPDGIPSSTLSLLTALVETLSSAHPGHVIRALLQHPGASDVIATLLTRGQAVATEAEAALGGGGGVALGAPTPAELAAWRDTTEALGRAFVEAA